MRDEEKLKRLRKLKELDASELNQLYSRVFDSDDGQMVMLDLELRCFKFVPPVGRTNEETNRYVGMQSVITTIESRINPIFEEFNKKKETKNV